MRTRLDELVERLGRLGLEDSEARVYYFLTGLGAAPAADIARASSVRRSDAYRVLQGLEEKGFVEKTMDRPAHFVPLPIEDALARAVDRQKRRVADLEQDAQELVDVWPEAPSQAPSAGRFAVRKGRTQVRAALRRLVEDAKHDLLLVASARGLASMEGLGVLDAVAAKAQDGVRCRILTTVKDANVESLQPLRLHCEIRHAAIPGFYQGVASDSRQLALFVGRHAASAPEAPNDTLLEIQSTDFVMAQEALVDSLWTTGVDLEDRVDEMTTGDEASRMEVLRGRWVRYDRMKDLIGRATDRVSLWAGRDEVTRWEPAGMLRVLRRTSGNGVQVEVHSDAASPNDLDSVAWTQLETRPPVVLLDADGHAFVVVANADEEPDEVVYDGEWAVWGTVPRQISRLLAGAALARPASASGPGRG